MLSRCPVEPLLDVGLVRSKMTPEQAAAIAGALGFATGLTNLTLTSVRGFDDGELALAGSHHLRVSQSWLDM